MKNIKYLGLLLVIFLMTGCIKYNVNMEIKNDKSMNLSIIYAMNKQVLESFSENKDILTDTDKEKLESQEFTIKDYDDGEMKGYTFTKKIKNIDEIASDKATEYSLSGVLDEESNNNLFQVTKGLLKNTYKAKFNFDISDSEYNSNLDTDKEESDNNEDTDTNLKEDLDFSSLASGMDLSFNVTLPSKAISNNATKTDDGLKKLTWKLDTSGMEAIEFEFEIYNMTTIYVGIIVLALFIILIVVIILGLKKGKNKNNNQEIKKESISEPSKNLDGAKNEVTEVVDANKPEVNKQPNTLTTFEPQIVNTSDTPKPLTEEVNPSQKQEKKEKPKIEQLEDL